MSGPGDLRARVLSSMASASPLRHESGPTGSLNRLCRTVVGELGVLGAAVNLMSPVGGSEAVVGSSDALSTQVDGLQFSVGKGPCHDAFATGRPVQATDLATDARWPGYCSQAQDCGVGAVFAFPLQVGAASLGVLDVYHDAPRILSEADLSLALAFAEIATETLLQLTATGDLSLLEPGLRSAVGSRYQIFQAQGMVMVRYDIPLIEALVRMRGFAFACRRELSDVARDILDGSLDLEVAALS